jgi:hypothetical protein
VHALEQSRQFLASRYGQGILRDDGSAENQSAEGYATEQKDRRDSASVEHLCSPFDS